MIYVHVPFCRSFCTYCDFYSEIACRGRDGEAFGHYADGVCDEIAGRRAEIAGTLGTNTLYIGGGTPSVLPLSCLERIVHALGTGPQKEFTIEVNPDDIIRKGPGYVKGLLDLGINRISMGIQSLDDNMLRWMNRRHDSAEAVEAFRILRDAGAGNISTDVIFGISHLSEKTMSDTLDGLLALRPDPISAYQLSIEDGSALRQMVDKGLYEEAEEALCRSQYELICRKLREAGFHHYEISNWAVPGREAVHNSAYWDRLPYVGLGPGAHSFIGNVRSWNTQELHGWTSESELLTPEDERTEALMLGLRTDKGAPASLCDNASMESLVAEGALQKEGDRVLIPESHFFVSDEIIRALL